MNRNNGNGDQFEIGSRQHIISERSYLRRKALSELTHGDIMSASLSMLNAHKCTLDLARMDLSSYAAAVAHSGLKCSPGALEQHIQQESPQQVQVEIQNEKILVPGWDSFDTKVQS